MQGDARHACGLGRHGGADLLPLTMGPDALAQGFQPGRQDFADWGDLAGM